MDLTEFGRVVHAEMCTICDAAREGLSIKNATLYCTTFPCHNCTKHIIASGLSRVVYMEPYPKSRAKELHEDEIQLEAESDKEIVSFVPFMGISPIRYHDIFQKGRRKSSTGEATAWMNKHPRPMLDIGFPAYTTTGEPWALAPLIGDLLRKEES
jgi:deoxycytidylate deaminase